VPGPAIVQSDRSILLEVAHPDFEAARRALAAFAELEKSPEHIHTYRISAVSLWNAAAAGVGADEIARTLVRLSRYEVPQAVLADVRDLCARYGRLRLVQGEAGLLRLEADEPALLAEVARAAPVAELLRGRPRPVAATLAASARGPLKQVLIELGWPVEDLAPYEDGDALELALREELELRPYQRDAAAAFAAAGAGVIVLPCGAGKTIVGLAAIAGQGAETLIVTSNSASLSQWRTELIAKTTLAPEAISEYSGQAKRIAPVTLTTYQMLTHRPRRDGGFPHLDLFERREWGLVIYDEVHLLPAPVFRATARIQARRRLGLTATLIREDGAEPLVFSLVGPKRYDTAWRELEDAGWIAGAECAEVRVPLPAHERMEYATAEERARFRIASENPAKDELVPELLGRHPGGQALVIGYYLGQLRRIADRLGAPLVTGPSRRARSTPSEDPAPRARGAVRALPERGAAGAVRHQGGELRARPALGERRGAGVRHLRLAPGRAQRDLRRPLAVALAARHAASAKQGRAVRWVAAPDQAAHDAAALAAFMHRTPVRVKTDGTIYSRFQSKLCAALPPLPGGLGGLEAERVELALDFMRLGGLVRLRVDDRPRRDVTRELVPTSELACAIGASHDELRRRLEQAALKHTCVSCAAALAASLEGGSVSLASLGRGLASLQDEAGVGSSAGGDPAALGLHALGPLWLIGALELGLDGDGVPTAVHLVRTEARDVSAPLAICQSNFELVLLRPPTPGERLALELAGEPVEGQAHVYRVTRASVRSAAGALAAGLVPAPPSGTVAGLLGALAGELPQNVERTVADWTPTIGSPLRLRSALMVEAGHAAEADELAGGPLAGLVVERLGDTLLALAATRLDELERAVAAAGRELEPGIDRVSGTLIEAERYASPSREAEAAWLPPVDSVSPGKVVSTLDHPPPEPVPVPTATGGSPADDIGPIAVVLQALEQQTDVAIVYAGARGLTERVITPFELDGAAVHAWCHLRDDERSFWLNSIQHAELVAG
jgi:DNA excision repair protein ERCC-3